MGKQGQANDKAAPTRRQSTKSNLGVPEESQQTAGVPSGLVLSCSSSLYYYFGTLDTP